MARLGSSAQTRPKLAGSALSATTKISQLFRRPFACSNGSGPTDCIPGFILNLASEVPDRNDPGSPGLLPRAEAKRQHSLLTVACNCGRSKTGQDLEVKLRIQAQLKESC